MAAPIFPIDEAYLIGGWAESFLWGCFTFLLFTTIYAVHVKHKKPFHFTTIATVIIYLLASVHMILALVRLIQGLILYRDTIGPVSYFATIPIPINVVKDYLYISILVLGDSVVVWRLYAVWGRDLRVAALPAMLVLTEAVVGLGSPSMALVPHARYQTVALWGMLMYIMSLATNILVTATVVLRIWYVARRARLAGLGGVYYRGMLLLVVESGALITIAKVIEFVLFEYVPGDTGSEGLYALYVVYECMPQITGIVPTLIVWAVHNGYTLPDESHLNSATDLAFASMSSLSSDTTAFSPAMTQACWDRTVKPDGTTMRKSEASAV